MLGVAARQCPSAAPRRAHAWLPAARAVSTAAAALARPAAPWPRPSPWAAAPHPAARAHAAWAGRRRMFSTVEITVSSEHGDVTLTVNEGETLMVRAQSPLAGTPRAAHLPLRKCGRAADLGGRGAAAGHSAG